MGRLSKRSTSQMRALVYLTLYGSKHSRSWRHLLAPNTSEPKTSAPVEAALADQQVQKASMTLGNFALSTLLSRRYRLGRPTRSKHFKQSFRYGGR